MEIRITGMSNFKIKRKQLKMSPCHITYSGEHGISHTLDISLT
jgi:hypothetical protein